MSMASARANCKEALLQFANNTNENKSEDEAVEDFLNALEEWITSAALTVPGTGLAAPNGPVTGSSTTGNLS